MSKRCDCGVKLISKYLDIGKCAKCQGIYKSYEYHKFILQVHDEKHGITKEALTVIVIYIFS